MELGPPFKMQKLKQYTRGKVKYLINKFVSINVEIIVLFISLAKIYY